MLLGGLYGLTKAQQGKDGSATDVMPAAKRVNAARDLFRQAQRFGAPLRFHPKHPLKSISAQRLLISAGPKVCACAAVLTVTVLQRVPLTHALYKAYWVNNEDISDQTVLKCKSLPTAHVHCVALYHCVLQPTLRSSALILLASKARPRTR